VEFRQSMTGHISVWRLASELGTYPELIYGLCRFNGVPVIAGPRGRMVAESDRELIGCLLYARRSVVKVSVLSGRVRRRKAARAARGRAECRRRRAARSM
jgi:hypothetical protein